MKDRELLIFIHRELTSLGVNEFFGYMHQLRDFIRATPSKQEAPTKGVANTLAQLKAQLATTGKVEEEESCVNCKFFLTVYQVCQRHSPIPHVDGSGIRVSIYPQTQQDKWCGDWKRKEEK